MEMINKALEPAELEKFEKMMGKTDAVSKPKPILCLDFDGVIHSYTSRWKGADVIPDPVVDGFFEWAEQAAQHFDLQIFSSRSNQPGGIEAMMAWLYEQRKIWREKGGKHETDEPLSFSFPKEKPPAMVTIDDRAITFTGEWPSIDTLKAFQPWNKKVKAGT